MANTEKRKSTAARLLKKSGEPTIEPLDYIASLMRALNWYNSEADNKEKRRWFTEYFGKNARGIGADVHDREFRTVGTLCRLLTLGQFLDEKEMNLVQSEFERIKALSGQAKQVSQLKPAQAVVKQPSIQDRLEEQASDFVGQFNEMIDAYTVDRKQIPDVDALMKQHPSSPVAKKVLVKIAKVTQELRDAVAGVDKQLIEGYSNFKKPELKKLLSAYESLADKLQQTKKIVVRKTRTPRVKPAGEVIKRMKFAKENVELGLKSVSPVGIVGADEVWLYNTKTKKFQYYKALNGMTLTVKGTSLMNFDADKSEQKTVRQPNSLAGLGDKGKRAYAQFLKSLTTKPATVNGRLNEDTIIMATFK